MLNDYGGARNAPQPSVLGDQVSGIFNRSGIIPIATGGLHRARDAVRYAPGC
jgi:hypothetical protein